MRMFLIKILIFLSPFILLLLIFQTYHISGGDLNRIGKVSVDADYRGIFDDIILDKKHYTELSDIDIFQISSFDVITIGDSFSHKGNIGYQNYLAKYSGKKILNITKEGSYKNPIQQLYNLINSGFIEKTTPKYIILQSVERHMVNRGKDVDREGSIDFKELSSYFNNLENTEVSSNSLQVIKDIFNYTYFSILYKLNNKAKKVYYVETDKELFSEKFRRLIFYHDDINHIKYITKDSVENLNNVLNNLEERLRVLGVELIVLPAPDKYDLYQDFIINNKNPRNDFFNIFNKLEKDYLYIDSKTILLDKVKSGIKDIYYTDDTHWSPIAADIIAKELNSMISVQYIKISE